MDIEVKRLIEDLDRAPKQLLNQYPELVAWIKKIKELAEEGHSKRQIEELIVTTDEYKNILPKWDEIRKASHSIEHKDSELEE